MNKFFFDILTNPNQTTYSSKRVGGYISLFATIGFGCMQYTEPMVITAGLVVAFFGLSTVDYKQYLVNSPTPTDKATENTF